MLWWPSSFILNKENKTSGHKQTWNPNGPETLMSELIIDLLSYASGPVIHHD